MHFSFSRPAVRCLILIAALLCLNACFRFTKLDGGPETLPATNPTETDPPETEPPETEPPETKVTAVSSGKPGGKTDFGQGKTPDPEPEPEPVPDPEPVPAPEPFSATLGQIREKNGISTLLASHRTVTVRLSRDFTGESYTQSFRMYDGRIAYLHLSEHAEEDPGTGETSVSRSLSGYYCNANFQEYPGIDGFYVKINIPLAFSNDREVYFERELTDWLDIGEVQSSELIEETDTAATLVFNAEEEGATTVLKLTVVKDTLDLLMIDYHSEENGFVYADTMTVSYDEELPEWAVFEAYEGSRPLRLECSAPDNLQPIEYRIPVDWTLSVDSSYSSWLLGEAPGDNGVDLLEYGPGQHIPETIYTWDSEVLSIDAPPAPEIDFTLEDLKAANNIRSLLAWNESVTARRTLRDAEEILSFWTKDGERVSYDLYIPADGSQSIAGSYNDFTFYIYNGMSLPYTVQKWITAQGGRSDGWIDEQITDLLPDVLSEDMEILSEENSILTVRLKGTKETYENAATPCECIAVFNRGTLMLTSVSTTLRYSAGDAENHWTVEYNGGKYGEDVMTAWDSTRKVTADILTEAGGARTETFDIPAEWALVVSSNEGVTISCGEESETGSLKIGPGKDEITVVLRDEANLPKNESPVQTPGGDPDPVQEPEPEPEPVKDDFGGLAGTWKSETTSAVLTIAEDGGFVLTNSDEEVSGRLVHTTEPRGMWAVGPRYELVLSDGSIYNEDANINLSVASSDELFYSCGGGAMFFRRS